MTRARSDHTARSWFRRVRSPWAIALLSVAFVGALGWIIFDSSVFAARTVVVVSAEQVTDEQVLRAADVPQELALARLPMQAIAARVEQLDAVATAQVEREWPDTVRIVVTERRPVAAVHTDAGFGIVGSDGSIYRTELTRPVGLPLLEQPTSAADAPFAAALGDVSAAFEVASSLPNTLRRMVEQVTAESAQTVRLVLRSGAIVEWGSASAGQRKSAVLLALIAHHAAHYDVSVPDSPAWSG